MGQGEPQKPSLHEGPGWALQAGGSALPSVALSPGHAAPSPKDLPVQRPWRVVHSQRAQAQGHLRARPEFVSLTVPLTAPHTQAAQSEPYKYSLTSALWLCSCGILLTPGSLKVMLAGPVYPDTQGGSFPIWILVSPSEPQWVCDFP